MNKTNTQFTQRTALYESVKDIFDSVFSELQGMAKKKPDGTLSKTKIIHLNRILTDIKLIFDGYPEAKYLDLLDDDELPQFSDALLILAQYNGALKSFHNKHWKFNGIDWDWTKN